MKKIIGLLAVALASSFAVAQKSTPFIGFGISRQTVDEVAIASFLVQGGAYRLIDTATGRITIGTGMTRSNFLEIDLDLMETFPIAKQKYTPYLGGGLGYLGDGGISFFGLRIVSGVDYKLDKEYTVGLELAPVVYLVNGGSVFGYQLRLGGVRTFCYIFRAWPKTIESPKVPRTTLAQTYKSKIDLSSRQLCILKNSGAVFENQIQFIGIKTFRQKQKLCSPSAA